MIADPSNSHSNPQQLKVLPLSITYKKPFSWSFVLHAMLIILLVINVNVGNESPVLNKGTQSTEIIEAVSLDQAQVDREAKRIQEQNVQKQQIEEEHQKALQEEAQQMEMKRQQEEQHLNELRQETAKMAEMQEQQKVAAEQAKVAEQNHLKALKIKQIAEEKKAAAAIIKAKKQVAEAALQAEAAAKAKAQAKAIAEAKAEEAAKAAEIKKQEVLKAAAAEEKANELKAEKAKADAAAKKIIEDAKIAKAKEAKAKADADAKAKAAADAKAAAAAQQAKADAAARQQAMMSHMQGEINKYKALIIQAIRHQWIVPDNVRADVYCQFEIRLAPGGTVLNVQLLKSSGDPLLDRSAQNAIYKASPLPVPADTQTFELFRQINLKVTPEIVG